MKTFNYTERGTLKVWQALAILCKARDGYLISEEKSRSILREIGMKDSEIYASYPEAGIRELSELAKDQKTLTREARKASQWMIQRN